MLLPILRTLQYNREYIITRLIERDLKIIVKKGMKIRRDTVIATGEKKESICVLDIASEYGIEPTDTKKYITCLHGEKVNCGDIIYKRKLGNICIKSPVEGIIDLRRIKKGLVQIKGTAKDKIEFSGLDGEIVSIVKNRKIEIKSSVFAIKTPFVFGNSVQGHFIFIEKPSECDLGFHLSQCIMFINFCPDLKFLQDLEFFGVRGVIINGMDYLTCVKYLENSRRSFTISLLTGFCIYQYRSDFLDLFRKNDGFICNLNVKKKEIIFSQCSQLLKKGIHTESTSTVKKSDIVQIFDCTNWGRFGKVERIFNSKIRLRDMNTGALIGDFHPTNLVLCQ